MERPGAKPLPLWWKLIQAARYLGVPPWELAHKPIAWMNHALEAKALDDEFELDMKVKLAKLGMD